MVKRQTVQTHVGVGAVLFTGDSFYNTLSTNGSWKCNDIFGTCTYGELVRGVCKPIRRETAGAWEIGGMHEKSIAER